VKIIKQNFEGLKVTQRERERERDCFYLSEINQTLDFSVFQFNIQHGQSEAIFAADFLYFQKNSEI